jgi:hydrogenase-4 component E
MSNAMYAQLLDLACGVFLLCAVLTLWRRQLTAIIALFAAQGFALGVAVALRGIHQHDAEVVAVAVGIAALRAVLLPYLIRRALSRTGETRETNPLVNVTASLLAAALLTLLAYAVSTPITELVPSPSTRALPAALAVVLIGFFVLITRTRAVSQVVGFLLLDNGITLIAFLTTTGVGFVVELGVSLDVLFAVLVLQVLASRMQAVFGTTDLDELRELKD